LTSAVAASGRTGSSKAIYRDIKKIKDARRGLKAAVGSWFARCYAIFGALRIRRH
jgi:hypothetical protein